jgi:endonuclease/exonuclease/phosphatase family metal-dependent hydrolase
VRRIVRSFARGGLAILALLTLVACALHVSNSGDENRPVTPAPDTLRIATFNVHYILLSQPSGAWSVGDWERRKGPMDQAIKAMDADVIAFQEMESFQRGSDGSVNLAREYLLAQNPGYGVAATGDWREFPSTQPIFYRKNRIQAVDQGWFFFSSTPDVIYSRTFNGSYPAFASWAQFEDRESGRRFRVVNVHFEYKSRSNRLLSAALVRDRITPWVDAGESVFLVGDINARFGARTIKVLEESGVTFDPAPSGTYHLNNGIHLFGAIDHLSRTDEVSLVQGPFVLQQKFRGEWPSDHHPVFADYNLPSTPE